MDCKNIGIETTVIIKPRKNFHSLIPARKRIKAPSIRILKDVPKSGWMTTKIKGIAKIKNGKKKITYFFNIFKFNIMVKFCQS